MCAIMDELRNEAEERGRAQGIEQGRLQMALELVREGVLSVGEAAKKAGVAPEAFAARMEGGGLAVS